MNNILCKFCYKNIAIKYFQHIYRPNRIISYCDLHWKNIVFLWGANGNRDGEKSFQLYWKLISKEEYIVLEVMGA